MNERIKELADAALIPFKDENGFECHHFSKELFAIWIIRECVEVVKWTPSQYPNDEYVKNIKAHFGVES